MASQEVLFELDRLRKELQRLEPTITHIETAKEVSNIVKGIPEKHEALIKTLEVLFKGQLSQLAAENKSLQEKTKDLQNIVDKETIALKALSADLRAIQKQINDVNFPQRLDKLDASVSGALSIIQSLQNRFDSVERNILDRIRDLSESQKDGFIKQGDSIQTLNKDLNELLEKQNASFNSQAELLSRLEKKSETQTILLYLAIGIGFIAAILTVITKI